MKKMFRQVVGWLFSLLLFTGTSFALNYPYPVWSTAADGTVTYGYLQDDGKTVISLQYESAGEFGACGLAAVGLDSKTALLNARGELLTDWVETPNEITFDENWAAFQYEDHIVYYNALGQPLPPLAGAQGFPSNGRIAFAAETEQGTLWGYYNEAGEIVIPASYTAAGAFAQGRALVRDELGDCHIIDVDGQELAALPGGATPVYLDIFCDDVIVLEAGGKQCLYSLAQMKFLTFYIYDEIQPFGRNCAIMRQDTLYGLLSATGEETLPATYPYLNELGEGVYAARGLNKGADIINERGAVVYTVDTYVGGLDTLHCGMTWYGTLTGEVAFLNGTGTFLKVVPAVETPEILTSNVARVMVDHENQWIDMLTGEVLHSSHREYTLEDGAQLNSAYYEKYLGMRADGSEYGWLVEYPYLTGLSDATVQQKINDGLRDFFVDGPYHSMVKDCGLTATYGYAEQKGLLVVWADGTYETSDTAVAWNESVIFDLTTGDRYTIQEDLFHAKSSEKLLSVLPEGVPYYGNARLDGEGIRFFRNHSAQLGQEPRSESVWFSLEELSSVLNYASALCQKLTGMTALEYDDVAPDSWSYRAIAKCTEKGLMLGDGGKFYPTREISLAEVTATLARLLALPMGTMPGPDAEVWYADTLGGAYEAGLLNGLPEETIQPTATITRVDMMQLLANTMERRDGAINLSEEAEALSLRAFSDVEDLSEERQRAAALCVDAGVVVGDGMSLRPHDTLTRAEFASVLAALLA